MTALTFFSISSLLRNKELKLISLIVNGQELEAELLNGPY